MTATVQHYFKENELFDRAKLEQWADHHLVRLRGHPAIPGLVILSYRDAVQYEKLWNPFTRRSRGLIVDLEQNKILGHSFDKFYNIDEMPDTKYEHLVTLGAFEATEKLDGSMLTAFWHGPSNQWLVASRSEFLNEYSTYGMAQIPTYMDDELRNFTLIFELIDPRFQNVINYTVKGYAPGLYLIGARHMLSDQLLTYAALTNLVSEYPCLGKFALPKYYTFASLDDCIAKIKDLPTKKKAWSFGSLMAHWLRSSPQLTSSCTGWSGCIQRSA